MLSKGVSLDPVPLHMSDPVQVFLITLSRILDFKIRMLAVQDSCESGMRNGDLECENLCQCILSCAFAHDCPIL